MSLFEIELNSDFKILNATVIFNEKDLKKYYKLNKLNKNISYLYKLLFYIRY